MTLKLDENLGASALRYLKQTGYSLADPAEKSMFAEAVRRDDELTAGLVVGREHGEIMRTARQRLGMRLTRRSDEFGSWQR